MIPPPPHTISVFWRSLLFNFIFLAAGGMLRMSLSRSRGDRTWFHFSILDQPCGPQSSCSLWCNFTSVLLFFFLWSPWSGESIKFKARHGLSGPFPGKQLVKHLPSKHLLQRRSSSEPPSSAASFLQSIVLSVAQKILEESGVKWEASFTLQVLGGSFRTLCWCRRWGLNIFHISQ